MQVHALSRLDSRKYSLNGADLLDYHMPNTRKIPARCTHYAQDSEDVPQNNILPLTMSVYQGVYFEVSSTRQHIGYNMLHYLVRILRKALQD